MMRILLALVAFSICTPLLADTLVSDADAQKIKAAMQGWGCSGGKMEREDEGTGVYEVDDAKCKDGQYDIKLDKEFKAISITRD